jgi:AraC-like DNA-binding protein
MSMMTGRFCFRYTGKPDGPDYEQWRDEFAHIWLAADFTPVGEDHLFNEISGTHHSFLSLCSMRGTPMRMDRRDDLSQGARDYLYLIIASNCRLQACQKAQVVDLSTGQIVLMSASEPARLTQLTQGSRWSVRIPRQRLADFCRNVEDKIQRPIANSELTNLLLHQVETAHRFGPKLDACANCATAHYVLDLVGLCLGADRDAAHLAKHRGLAAARLDEIKAEIMRNLGRPDIDLARLAANHGLKTRYVQRLFELAGTSFTKFVLEQRLLLAHRLLSDPKSRWRKISDIAAGAGFSDISYFNRAFRARFGAVPRDVRTAP